MEEASSGRRLVRPANGTLASWIKRVALQFDGDDCLIWPFNRGGDGYGRATVSGRYVVVSRYLCEAVHGLPPTPLHQAAHCCGNGKGGCVNPRHLRWATPKENNADKVDHGTANRGGRCNLAKLDESQVRDIRARSAKGQLQREIARLFDIDKSTVSDIVRGKSWGWL